MWLDLRKIIESPGEKLDFAVTLDPEHLSDPAIRGFKVPPEARGEVVNTAGLLDLRGTVRAHMHCVCDRCGTEFDRSKQIDLQATVTADPEADDDPEIFPLEGDWLDLDEVLTTLFILDMDTKFLCKEDCAGLCPQCGKNLNDGPCGCKKPRDPRMAVLEQLLDDKD